ncbi:MAG: peptide-methionine (S)-S-oxide reductase, partial [Kiritimatiellia bacterium]
KVSGVIEVQSGYSGGEEQHPTYYQVGSGGTGHTEGIRVVYNPQKVSYDELLHYYWRHVDPFDAGGQFCDRGRQYRPAILPVNAEQRAAASKSKEAIEALFGKPVAVQLETPGTFWVAEANHQNFYKTNPAHYNRYRTGCGRDRKVEAIWKALGGAH